MTSEEDIKGLVSSLSSFVHGFCYTGWGGGVEGWTLEPVSFTCSLFDQFCNRYKKLGEYTVVQLVHYLSVSGDLKKA